MNKNIKTCDHIDIILQLQTNQNCPTLSTVREKYQVVFADSRQGAKKLFEHHCHDNGLN